MYKRDCMACRFCKMVHATGGWSFSGCYANPYHGKWTAEIKECPLTPEEAERSRIERENKPLSLVI